MKTECRKQLLTLSGARDVAVDHKQVDQQMAHNGRPKLELILQQYCVQRKVEEADCGHYRRDRKISDLAGCNNAQSLGT